MYFRMDADHKKAYIGIELMHRDAGVQALYAQQLQQVKALLQETLEEEWIWFLNTKNEHGKTISRIYTEKGNVSIFKKSDWPQLISFFKPRIIALDIFWSTAKFAFEAMR